MAGKGLPKEMKEAILHEVNTKEGLTVQEMPGRKRSADTELVHASKMICAVEKLEAALEEIKHLKSELNKAQEEVKRLQAQEKEFSNEDAWLLLNDIHEAYFNKPLSRISDLVLLQ
uniref:Uncharacterized protein n=1 Tax=Aureoumbra lagunensis TaxID=44058 RepID=A0A7S3K2E5_9STRA